MIPFIAYAGPGTLTDRRDSIVKDVSALSAPHRYDMHPPLNSNIDDFTLIYS